MTAKDEFLFMELCHSLLSLDNELNVAQSVIIFISSCSEIVAIREIKVYVGLIV